MAEGAWVLFLVAKKKLFVILYAFYLFAEISILRMDIGCLSVVISEI